MLIIYPTVCKLGIQVAYNECLHWWWGPQRNVWRFMKTECKGVYWGRVWQRKNCVKEGKYRGNIETHEFYFIDV